MQSPCLTCATSPCCTYLPLQTFGVGNLIELDRAVYLLNFDRIELGLSREGEWSAYYRFPCRFLSREDFSCTVHQTPQQPSICVHYNPYNCWYKRALTHATSPDFLRIDRARMEFIVQHTQFDTQGSIVDAPSWQVLQDAFGDSAIAAQGQFATNGTHAERPMVPLEMAESYAYSDQSLRDPCTGCGAYCCETLLFPQEAPTSLSALDYIRFCLGFPGLEVGVSDTGWTLIVTTRCRHLVDNRCGIFGQPERPLTCRYYDEWKCLYKVRFGQPRPSDFVRVALDQFEALAECFRFDSQGTIVEYRSSEDIRRHLEANPSAVTS
jgi:hypothetical protein